jgi:hypothetical protein
MLVGIFVYEEISQFEMKPDQESITASGILCQRLFYWVVICFSTCVDAAADSFHPSGV